MSIDLTKKPFNLNADGVKWVEETLASMTEEEKLGQLFCLVAYSDDEGMLKYFARDLHAGGLMCRPMANNKELISIVNILQENSKIPMLIAANLEAGGDGLSAEGTRVGSQMQIAATGDVKYARALGEVIGAEAHALGGNWAFAPVIDIDGNFRNPITATRTYGSDPEMVKLCGVEYTKAVQAHGVAVSIKHFPGDGCDERDQHLVTSVNSLSCEDWDKTYGEVYKACIEAGALTVMVGHIMQPAYSKALNPDLRDEDIMPGALAPELLNGLLREKLGFNGMIVTDASSMNGFMIPMHRKKAVPLSIAAGCDMFLFTKNLEEDFGYMRDGIKEGIITRERLDEAVTRILAVKAAIGLSKKPVLDAERAAAVTGCEKHKAIAREVADKSITLEKNIQDVLPVTPEKYKRVLFHPIDPNGFSMFGNNENNKIFAEKLRQRGFSVDVYEPKPTFEGLAAGYAETVGKYDLMIYSASLATKSNQTTVRIEWAQPMGANVPMYINAVPSIFISLENPYHLLDVPRIKTYINTFGANEIVLDALIDKLTGKSEFKGKSPVDAFVGKWDTRI
ncbi:MAG: glycoside hydrolase family 3 protein [Oscillospiraceae bacterium]|jgi:beta-N-acetylhexosaminidase|nr:glycoside hydrolase family 3 protein [Oscillospiraceae bacterium]